MWLVGVVLPWLPKVSCRADSVRADSVTENVKNL